MAKKMVSDELMREEFEKAYLARYTTIFPGANKEFIREHMLKRDPDGFYLDKIRLCEWWAWQESYKVFFAMSNKKPESASLK